MTSKIHSKIDDTQKILLKRHLNKNGEAQKLFTKKVEEYSNVYVPFLTGNLKDSEVKVNTNNITYTASYAKKQYYNNVGLGKQGMNLGGLRGPRWEKRMWADRSNEIIKEVASFVGGKIK